MGTPTYTPLANITLGSSAASVTFSSISQSYRDLVLVSFMGVSADIDIATQFNSDTGSNYTYVNMRGNGSTATSGTGASAGAYFAFGLQNVTVPTNTQTNVIMNIMDYSATDKHKVALKRVNEAGTGTQAFAGRWASTSAITSIKLTPQGGNFNSGSTFALYGIAS
jgi:hypothetical protein